ncbi:MAG: Uma2 family endonuclease [Clostridia bacterium]|nr:Uma2 family endonuclease [Clostridia bacterium]
MIIEEMQKRRKELGLTYEELARKSGVPLSTVQKILGGFTENPNYRTILALEEALQPQRAYYHVEEQPYPMVEESRMQYLTKRDGTYTTADLENLPPGVRCELWDGKMVLLASPSARHEYAVGYLVGEFYAYIKKNGGNCRVCASNMGVKKHQDDRNYLLPDVQVICDPSKQEGEGADLAIEVTSPSSEKTDLNLKPAKYAQMGVREYWVICLQQKRVVVYDLEHDAPVAFYSFDDTVPVGIYGGAFQIDFRDLQNYLDK